MFTLRSLEDATAIREAAAQVRDAVVVGSGFIGMEVAASLTELGLDVSLVSRDVDLFAQLRSPEISEHLVRLYRHRGVDIIRGDEVRAFRGGSRLDTVELHAGEPLGAGLAVVGIGVQPAVSFIVGSGIAADDGILVDSRFETNVPGVYDAVSTFFTESFGLTLKVFGHVSCHDDRVSRGSFADGNAIAFYFARDRLVATLHAGQDEETEQTLKRLIRARTEPRDHRLLGDEAVPLDEAFAAVEASGPARLAS